jgi:peptidylprolyl isomerase
MRRLVATAAVFALASTACGTTSTPEVLETATDAAPDSELDLQTKPEFIVDTNAPAPSALVIEDLIVGTGDEAVAGSAISVHYVGKALSTGAQFDASWDRGSTFDFNLGAGQVIAGWDQGFAGMKVGGRRKLTIPASLGYGDRGAGADIKPGETLVFVVDLLAVSAPLGAGLTKPEFEVDTTAAAPADLVIEDLTVGDGAEAVSGTQITVHYVGKALSTGVQFDASWDRGEPFVFALGIGQVITGWDEGFAGMRVGGRRMLTIPADKAYGDRGAGADIKAGETLIFVVDLLAVG